MQRITYLTITCFIAVIAFFNLVDVYHQHFFTSGWLISIYNLLRLSIIPLLMWIAYFLGETTLRLAAPDRREQTLTLESSISCILAGIGMLAITTFFIGLAGFYTRMFASIFTGTILLLSLPRMRQLSLSQSGRSIKPYYPGIALIGVPLVLFLVTKGLYPAGGHDYYDHYFHFYRQVTQTGSILPNEVWYHFYYSKGEGLFFLTMLLTDPLAPQLVTTMLILLGACMVYSILKPTTQTRLLPWAGAALYLFFLIYTPGPLENLHHGGWADLEKPHEPAAALTLAMLWLSIQLARGGNARYWGVTLGLVVSAIVLTNPVMAVFVAIYLFLTTCAFLFMRNKPAALWSGVASILAGSWLASLWILNYFLTGLPDDQSLFVFWPYINFEKINQWGILFELLIVHWSKTGLTANSVPISLTIFAKLFAYVRLDVWWPLMLLILAALLIILPQQSLRRASTSALDKKACLVLGGFLLLVTGLSLFIGRDQPISYYRFTTFSYAPMLCLCLLCLNALLRRWKPAVGIILVLALLPPFVLSSHLSVVSQYRRHQFRQVTANGFRFVSGRYSLADAYQHQEGWPGRMEWGGIYPAALTVWKLLPRNTPIWSLHTHTYCMLPDCRMEGYMSYRFSRHMADIYYGNPEQAKKWLRAENHDYFFIANSLPMTDPLPRSPLFSPEHISNYLGIVWTDGDNTLLTWKENARLAIDNAWLQRYQQQANTAPAVQSFPYDDMKIVLNLAARQSRLQAKDLPWYHAGWNNHR